MIVDDSLMFYYTGQWNFATARKLTHAAAGEDFGFCVSDLIILDTMFYIIRLPCNWQGNCADLQI